jgi:hypothetical protein
MNIAGSRERRRSADALLQTYPSDSKEGDRAGRSLPSLALGLFSVCETLEGCRALLCRDLRFWVGALELRPASTQPKPATEAAITEAFGSDFGSSSIVVAI